MVTATPGDKQCEVVLVGCGAPKRGMGWYHAVQMLKDKCPSAKLCYIVEPWFMGPGTSFFSLFFLDRSLEVARFQRLEDRILSANGLDLVDFFVVN